MSFFGNRDNRNDEPAPRRRRSVLGAAFNPNIGTSFRALKESLYIFVKLIALVFAQAELIDRRHPVVTGADKRRYSLTEVIMMAYERVEWRQENLPQNSVFIGVCACIALTFLALVYVIFGSLMGLSGQ